MPKEPQKHFFIFSSYLNISVFWTKQDFEAHQLGPGVGFCFNRVNYNWFIWAYKSEYIIRSWMTPQWSKPVGLRKDVKKEKGANTVITDEWCIIFYHFLGNNSNCIKLFLPFFFYSIVFRSKVLQRDSAGCLFLFFSFFPLLHKRVHRECLAPWGDRNHSALVSRSMTTV